MNEKKIFNRKIEKKLKTSRNFKKENKKILTMQS